MSYVIARRGVEFRRQLCRDLVISALQVGVWRLIARRAGLGTKIRQALEIDVAKYLWGGRFGLKWIAIAFPSDNILSASRTLTFYRQHLHLRRILRLS